MKLFNRLAKKAVKEKIVETVDNNWDTIAGVIGVLLGSWIFFGGRKDDKKRDTPTSVHITYNYYDQRDQRRMEK